MTKGAHIYYGILAGLPQTEVRDQAPRQAIGARRRSRLARLALPRLRRPR